MHSLMYENPLLEGHIIGISHRKRKGFQNVLDNIKRTYEDREKPTNLLNCKTL